MLTIRMQRTGRKGLATFRVVVQDSRFTPTSGRVVAQVGHSNPHTKETVLDVEKINQYLENGAQPTPRVVRLLLAQKVKLPSWVAVPSKDKKSTTKNTEKLRKHQPKKEPEQEQEPEQEPAAETSEEPEQASDATEGTTEEKVAEEVEEKVEAPADTPEEA